MNKVFIGLILAVCVLGMGLVMLNNRLGRSPDPRQAPPAAEMRAPSFDHPVIEEADRKREIAEAASRQEDETASTLKEYGTDIPPTPPRMPDGLSESGQFIPPEPPDARKGGGDNKIGAVAPTPERLPQKNINQADLNTPAAASQKPEPKPATIAKGETPKTEQKPDAPQKPEPAKDSQHSEKGNIATRFVVYSRDKGATVRIGGNSKMDFNHMILENPNRIVVDLPGDWRFPDNPGIPRNELVQAVRVGKNEGKTRVVIDLKEKPRRVNIVPFKDGNGLDVRVDK